MSALHIAARAGLLDIVEYLCNVGVYVDQENQVVTALIHNFMTLKLDKMLALPFLSSLCRS